MKKEELDELLKSPDFSGERGTADGPYSLEFIPYRNRRDIGVRVFCGNYFFSINPYYSGVEDEELKKMRTDWGMYYGTNENSEKRSPEEDTSTKEEIMKRLGEYLDELEKALVRDIKRNERQLERIKTLRP